MDRQVIVTRPQAEAVAWVAALQQAGIQARMLPLIEIEPTQKAPVLPLDWLGSVASKALMFVSPAAARHGLAGPRSGTDALSWLRRADCRLWVTGPGTARELQMLGLPLHIVDQPASDAKDLDSEALWRIVSRQVRAPFHLLVLRGRDVPGGQVGRPWLADRVQQAGGAVRESVVYERLQPAWNEQQELQARGFCEDGSIWLLTSSQAIRNLQGLLPGQDWSKARALTTHGRIAESARQLGFGVVVESRPGLDALIPSIKSSDEFGPFPSRASDSGASV